MPTLTTANLNPEQRLKLIQRALVGDFDEAHTPSLCRQLQPADIDLMQRHGIHNAFYIQIRQSPYAALIASDLHHQLEFSHRNLSVRELAQQISLNHALQALHAASINVLVIKGTALIQQIYGPGVRDRCDVDLWVEEDDFDTASDLLLQNGFFKELSIGGRWVQPEQLLTHRDFSSNGLAIDLHRRLNSVYLLAQSLPFKQVWQRADPYNSFARIPCPADALLIAALHRTAHHLKDANRLIWIYDVDQIIRKFPNALEQAANIAMENKIAAILAEILQKSQREFASDVDAQIFTKLNVAGSKEISARWLQPMNPVSRLVFNWWHLPSFTARLAFIREHLFPSPSYMRQRYAVKSLFGVFAAYIARPFFGLKQYLK